MNFHILGLSLVVVLGSFDVSAQSSNLFKGENLKIDKEIVDRSESVLVFDHSKNAYVEKSIYGRYPNGDYAVLGWGSLQVEHLPMGVDFGRTPDSKVSFAQSVSGFEGFDVVPYQAVLLLKESKEFEHAFVRFVFSNGDLGLGRFGDPAIIRVSDFAASGLCSKAIDGGIRVTDRVSIQLPGQTGLGEVVGVFRNQDLVVRPINYDSKNSKSQLMLVPASAVALDARVELCRSASD